MIQVTELVKRYGEHLAVDQVSFEAGEGHVLGLLGPNGAGKSTIMRVLTGYLAPSAGEVSVAGLDVVRHSMEVRRLVGYLPENAGLYPELRVHEYLGYRAGLRGLRGRERRRQVDRVVESCRLEQVESRIVGQLSKGYRQRVALAATLLHDPPVLVLDEPTVGLDPLQVREIRALVRQLGASRTVLFSSHVLSEVEAVCGEVVIINNGRLVARGAPAELTARNREQPLELSLLGDVEKAVAAMRGLDGVHSVEISSGATGAATTEPVHLLVGISDPHDHELRARLSQAVVAAGAVILELAPRRSSLDEAFARITRASTDMEEAS